MMFRSFFISLALVLCNNLYAQPCVDPSLINPDAICITLWDPVCGCNGVTYGNACEAVNFGGVTSWTQGECGGGPIMADPCTDVGSISFGVCAAFLGYAVVNGQCAPVSGCGYIVDNVDYSLAFSSTLEDCNGSCGQLIIADPCTDVAGVDFGPCDMFMGYALVNGVCTGISGCGYVVDGTDYTAAFVQTLDECNTLCAEITPSEECADLTNVDFGECTTPLGIGVVNGTCAMISGCSAISGTTDYSPALYANMADCEACLPNNGVDDFNDQVLRIYPNPFKDELIIQLKFASTGTITISDLSGRNLHEMVYSGKKIIVTPSDLQAGAYLLSVNGENFRIVESIVRQ